MATSSVVLDTSAYPAFRRGAIAAVEAIQLAETIFVPTIVVGELLFGFALGSRPEQNRRELDDFLSSPRVTISPITLSTAERCAWIHKHLRSTGKPIPTNDLWIAACTWDQGGVLLTADGHFEEVPQIMVQVISV